MAGHTGCLYAALIRADAGGKYLPGFWTGQLTAMVPSFEMAKNETFRGLPGNQGLLSAYKMGRVVVAQAFNSSSWKAKAGRSLSLSQPGLQRMFQDN